MKAVISNRIYLSVTPKEAAELAEKLTYRIFTARSRITGGPEIIRTFQHVSGSMISLPAGRLDLVPPEYELVDKRVTKYITDFPEPSFILRPSQQDVHDQLVDSAIVNAPVSWGKTYTAIAIAHKLKQKTLIVTHNTMLRDQWALDIEKTLGFVPCLIGSGKFSLNTPIVVANVQTLTKRMTDVHSEFGTVILDECLDYEATVDTLEFGKVKIGALVNNKKDVHVRSFDLETNKEVYRRVVNWYKKPFTECLKIKHALGSLKATANHSFFIETANGIEKVRAENLKLGDRLILTNNTHKANCEMTEAFLSQSNLDPFEPIKVDTSNFIKPYHTREITSIEPAKLTGNNRFNIEVEGTHTYFANNVLVSNCHHTPASTFSSIIDKTKARYRIGLSGTLERKDGKHVIIPDYFGHTVFKPPAENYMVPEVVIVKTDIKLPAGDIWANKVTELEVHNTEYQKLIIQLADSAANSGHKVLVVGSRTQFLEAGPSMTKNKAVCITGSITDVEERNRLLASLESDTKILFGTISIFSEGISQNDLSCIILATPTSNKPMLTQLIGRIVRLKEGKKSPLILDINLADGISYNQARTRLGVYLDNGYRIRTLDKSS